VENVKVAPPFEVVGVINVSALDVNTKSDAKPVVLPDAPATTMVQLTAFPTRSGFEATQDKLDAVVGVP